MYNIVVFTRYAEHMQGIIRGIEKLDEKHEYGIVHGMSDLQYIDEANQTIADLTGAVILVTQHISFPYDEKIGKELIPENVIVIDLPGPLALGNAKREDIIDYIVNEKGEKLLRKIKNIASQKGMDNLQPYPLVFGEDRKFVKRESNNK